MKVIISPLHERIKEDKDKDIEDPFSYDAFGRKDFVDNLTRLFRNSNEGLVVTIDSEWGGGKTTLVKLWEYELEKDEQFIPIYYDAFRNDFTGDAFLSIAVKIYEALEKEMGTDVLKNKVQFEHLKKTSKDLLKTFLKMGSTAAVGSITGGLVDSKGVVDASKKAWEKLALGTLDLNVNQQFEAHSKSVSLIEQYQTQLKTVVALKGDNRKIVFFIDELDRCRPDFAIHVIEKVKHLFNVDNVHFVLAVNRSQLLQTISSAYGVSGGEASTYLQKFVHLETKLPGLTNIRTQTHVHVLQGHLQSLWDAYEMPKHLQDDDLKNSVASLLGERCLSLNPREIERVMGLVAIYVITAEDADINSAYLAHFAAALKTKDSDVFDSCRDGKVSEYSENEQLSRRIFKWVKTTLPSLGIAKDSPSPDAFEVDGLREVCAVMDIYEFPEEKPAPVEESLAEPTYEQTKPVERTDYDSSNILENHKTGQSIRLSEKDKRMVL